MLEITPLEQWVDDEGGSSRRFSSTSDALRDDLSA